ncbi:MAG: glycerate kinase [Longimicrobiales bacterium]
MDALVAGALAAVEPGALVRGALADFAMGRAATPGDALSTQPEVGPGVRMESDVPAESASSVEPDILVAAVGKAAWGMVRGAVEAVGPRIREVVVVAPEDGPVGAFPSPATFPPHRFIRGGHPLPDEGSLAGARTVLDLVRGADPAERVVFLLSGGASALLSLPPDDVSLDDLALTSRLLMQAGADIVELNTVRKHLDRVKGGGLARAAAPTSLWAGILSDVVGDRLDVIGSGPVSPDPTTFDDALEVVRTRIPDGVPPFVLEHLERGSRGEVPETPARGDPCFETVETRIIGNAGTALAGAARTARARGYEVREGSATVTGEAREVGRELGRIARRIAGAMREGDPIAEDVRPESPTAGEIRRSPGAGRRGVCYLSAGETTVTVTGAGRGGPNQEAALAAALELAAPGSGSDPVDGEAHPPVLGAEIPDMLVASVGTDGIDGPTDVAGAVADPTTVGRARRAGISPEAALEHNDSYSFFRALGDQIRTGPTGTNVMDLHVVLVRDRGGRTSGR